MRHEVLARRLRVIGVTAVAAAALAATACSRVEAPAPARAFAAPEEAVAALSKAVASGDRNDVLAIFGADAQALVDSSDPAGARLRRQVFAVALAEGWHLADDGPRKVLVVGHESWPFPVPLVQDGGRWRFDAAAGTEEVIARRIGRNELAALQVCRVYVLAQRAYVRDSHDGRPPGLYAAAMRSDPGKRNGLYWPAANGQPRSPLGELLSRAAADGRLDPKAGGQPSPFQGYYFRVLTAQGPAAPGGARQYLVNGVMSGGFALVAWPAEYDATGVMTFVVNQDGIVYEKDLGPATEAAAKAMAAYDPDPSWAAAD